MLKLQDFEKAAILDGLEGWELIELLQISIEDVLDAALDSDWLNEDNVDEVMDSILTGVRE